MRPNNSESWLSSSALVSWPFLEPQKDVWDNMLLDLEKNISEEAGKDGKELRSPYRHNGDWVLSGIAMVAVRLCPWEVVG